MKAPHNFLPAWLLLALVPMFATAQRGDSAAGSEDPPNGEAVVLEEVLEVRRVNVDVVVTDRDGAPVEGLSKDRFALVVGGRPVSITNFSEITAAHDAQERARPQVVVLVDRRTGEPGTRIRLIGDIVSSLEQILEHSGGVIVASLGTKLVIDQTLTRDPALIEAALSRAAEPVPLGTQESVMLMREVEQARPLVPDPVMNEMAISGARTLLSRIRSAANSEGYETTRTIDQLRHLIKALSGLPERSIVLFLSGGLDSTPVELAYRQWWSKYDSIAASLGVSHVEDELSRVDQGDYLETLVADAANARVVFYTLGLGSRGRRGFSAETTRGTSMAGPITTFSSSLEGLEMLSSETGGLAALRANRAGDAIDQLVRDVSHYYSLAFDPTTAPARRTGVRVRVDGRGFEVRSVRRYRARTTGDVLEERMLSSLYLDATENRHNLSVDLTKAERIGKSRYLVELSIRVPVAQLTLLPESSAHRGRIDFALAALGENGGGSPSVTGAIPIEIPNNEMMSWVGKAVGGRLEFVVAADRQKIALAVRDAIGGEVSTINLVFDPRSER